MKIPAYVDLYADIAKTLHTIVPTARMGLGLAGLGRLRADSLAEAVLLVTQADASAPVMIPVGGARAELEAVRTATGARPVDWLLHHAPVGPRWTLLHATQAGEGELQGMLQAGVTAAVAPLAEADDGYGVFPVVAWRERGGRLGLAASAAQTAAPAAELAFLERVQRLARRRRGVLGPPPEGASGRYRRGDSLSIGRHLWLTAVAGGQAPAGLPLAGIAKGQRADLVVLNGEHALLCDKTGDQLLDGFVFNHQPGMIDSVMVAGRWVVADSRHGERRKAEAAFRKHLWKVVAVA